MKTKLSLLLAFVVGFSVSVFAGQLVDNANLFDADADAVRTAISDLPVWIETREHLPSEGIRPYADRRAAEITDRGYYVVITTNPRQWRISMHPTTLASPSAIKAAGDRMISQFKAGHYSQGAIQVARELAALPPPPPTANHAPAPSPRPAYHPPATPLPYPKTRSTLDDMFPVFVCFGIIGFLAIIIFFARRARRAQANRVFNLYTKQQRAELIQRYAAYPQATYSAIDDPFLFWALMNAVEAPTPGSSDSSWSPMDSSSSSSGSFDSGSSGGSSSSCDSSGAGGSW